MSRPIPSSRAAQRGFTLIERMIVLALGDAAGDAPAREQRSPRA